MARVLWYFIIHHLFPLVFLWSKYNHPCEVSIQPHLGNMTVYTGFCISSHYLPDNFVIGRQYPTDAIYLSLYIVSALRQLDGDAIISPARTFDFSTRYLYSSLSYQLIVRRTPRCISDIVVSFLLKLTYMPLYFSNPILSSPGLLSIEHNYSLPFANFQAISTYLILLISSPPT